MANILGILWTQKWQNIYFEDQIKLCFKSQAVQIEEVFSKNIYSEIRARYDTELDLLHKRDLKNNFPIYAVIGTISTTELPFNVLIDDKSGEFQHRNFKYLTTNSFRYNMKLVLRIHHYVHHVL